MNKHLRIFAIFIVILYALYMNAAYTNLFHYGYSLESLFASLVLNILAFLYTIIGFAFLGSNDRIIGWLYFVLPIFIVSVHIKCNKDAFGEAIPSMQLHHTDVCENQEILFLNKPLKYALKLQDPFASNHQEFIVIQYGAEHEIKITLFDHPLIGYMKDPDPSRWISVRVIMADHIEFQINAASFGEKKAYSVTYSDGDFFLVNTR